MAVQKLLPKSVAKTLPALYSQDGKGYNAIARVRYFCPRNGWEWFATEYDPEDRIFFGLTNGWESELGNFSLDEFEENKRWIFRDEYFQPKPLQECLSR
jgi:hypothetical protein